MQEIFKREVTKAKNVTVAMVTKADLQTIVSGADVAGAVDVPAGEIEAKVQKPGVSGLTPVPFSVDGSTATFTVSDLKEGENILRVVFVYGNNTKTVVYVRIVVSPSGSATSSFTYNVPVVSSVGDGAAGLVIDAALSESSTNPVQNKVVTAALADKQPSGTYADGEVYTKPEDGHATIADDKLILGAYPVEDESDVYALIVGNGADAEHPSNAFAIDRTGNLVLFNAGAAVTLTPAKLAALIA